MMVQGMDSDGTIVSKERRFKVKRLGLSVILWSVKAWF